LFSAAISVDASSLVAEELVFPGGSRAAYRYEHSRGLRRLQTATTRKINNPRLRQKKKKKKKDKHPFTVFLCCSQNVRHKRPIGAVDLNCLDKLFVLLGRPRRCLVHLVEWLARIGSCCRSCCRHRSGRGRSRAGFARLFRRWIHTEKG